MRHKAVQVILVDQPRRLGELPFVEHAELPRRESSFGSQPFLLWECGIGDGRERNKSIIRVTADSSIIHLLLQPAEMIWSCGDKGSAFVNGQSPLYSFPGFDGDALLSILI